MIKAGKFKFPTDLLADALDDALDVHLAEAEDEERAALLVLVVPPAGKELPHHGRLLVLRQDLQEERREIRLYTCLQVE